MPKHFNDIFMAWTIEYPWPLWWTKEMCYRYALRVLLKACKITKIYRFYACIQFEYYSSSEIQIHVFTFRKYSKITHIHLLHITEMENRSLRKILLKRLTLHIDRYIRPPWQYFCYAYFRMQHCGIYVYTYIRVT